MEYKVEGSTQGCVHLFRRFIQIRREHARLKTEGLKRTESESLCSFSMFFASQFMAVFPGPTTISCLRLELLSIPIRCALFSQHAQNVSARIVSSLQKWFEFPDSPNHFYLRQKASKDSAPKRVPELLRLS